MVKNRRCRTKCWKKVYVACLIFMLFSAKVYAELPATQDYPHNEQSNGITCSACHIVKGTQQAAPTTSDASCGNCHTGSGSPLTHSSLNASGAYGTWTVACVTCHDPHQQQQVWNYGSDAFLYSAASTSVLSGREYSTITKAAAGWTDHQWQGLLMIGNTAAPAPVFYKIFDNSSDTITVEGPLSDGITTGDTFAIVYGQSIKQTINYTKTNVTPRVNISGPIKFFSNTGTNSYTSGTPIAGNPPVATQGLCVACHTKTRWYTKDGNNNDSHYPGSDCTSCHTHQIGFNVPAVSTNSPRGGVSAKTGLLKNTGAKVVMSGGPTALTKSMNDPNASYNSTTKQCSGIYCHSDGSGNATRLAAAVSPSWGTTMVAYTSGNECGGCHNNPPQYVGQSHYVGSSFMGKEGGHLVGIHFDNIFSGTSGLAIPGTSNASSHGNAGTSTTISCYICHNGEVSSAQIDTYSLSNLSSSALKCANCHTASDVTVPPQAGVITDKSKHVNGTIDVVIAPGFTVNSKAQLKTSSLPAGWTRNNGYKAAGSYDSATLNSSDWNASTQTCTTACHNSQPVTWGAGNITCVSCHTQLP